MKKSKLILDYLNELFPNPKCELNYNQDYELLIAVVLSAQCTDKRVNVVTKNLFKNYPSLEALSYADYQDVANTIKSLGSYTKKSQYILDIAQDLINKYEGQVPNNMEDLIKLSGVGRKTANVVLSVLYNYPAIAVDTHVMRVSKRLGITKTEDTPLVIEKKLQIFFPKETWSRLHHQLVLFGRYKCKALKPQCYDCQFLNICKEKRKNI